MCEPGAFGGAGSMGGRARKDFFRPHAGADELSLGHVRTCHFAARSFAARSASCAASSCCCCALMEADSRCSCSSNATREASKLLRCARAARSRAARSASAAACSPQGRVTLLLAIPPQNVRITEIQRMPAVCCAQRGSASPTPLPFVAAPPRAPPAAPRRSPAPLQPPRAAAAASPPGSPCH